VIIKRISKVGIVGAGTMGRRIAFQCLAAGREVGLFDISNEAAEAAQEAIRSWFSERAANCRPPRRGRREKMPSPTICTSIRECVSGVDLAIETVTEDERTKRKVFAEIDRHAGPRTLIATNTSSLPGSRLADATRRPEKTFNFNFGPLGDLKVEVMGHPRTAPSSLEAAVGFVWGIGLVPILVKREIMGYALNRVWRAVKKEVLFLIEGGYATAEDIDQGWILEWKTSLGPCGLMDVVGLDVVRDIEMVYYKNSRDPSDRPPKFLLKMIREGKLGVKSGEGFYKYPSPAYGRPGWLMRKGRAAKRLR
jgi:3-hydroxybutyryl-CoA dehydrogenase